MSDFGASSGPVLADPVLLDRPAAAIGLAPAGIAVGGFLFAACWLLVPGVPQADRYVPRTAADLGPSLVTPIDPGDTAAIRAAVSALQLPEPQRRQIEPDVLAGRRRIGWIVFTDSMDPDGDVVAVESGGLIQNVLLNKSWTPVAVPLTGLPIGSPPFAMVAAAASQSRSPRA